MLRLGEILLVEDSPADAERTFLAIRQTPVRSRLSILPNGPDATDFILFHWKPPKVDGAEVLAFIKAQVVVLTGCHSSTIIRDAYDLHANCFISKPIDPDRSFTVIKSCAKCGRPRSSAEMRPE